MNNTASGDVSKCLIIVGMHRSGTSLLASILQKAGLFIGEELLEAGESNKKGHFENLDFLNFHMKVLSHPDGWNLETIDSLTEEDDAEAIRIIEKNSRHEWGWKEPRTTLMLNYWRKKIPSTFYLFVYRNPWDVVDSLFRRSSDEQIISNPLLAFEIWNHYNRQIIETYTRYKDRSILMHIEDIVKDIPSFIQTINTRLGFHLHSTNTDDLFDSNLYADSSKNEYRSWQTAGAFPEVIDTLNELRALTGKPKYQIKGFDKSIGSSMFFRNLIKDWFYSIYHKKQLKRLTHNFNQELESLVAEQAKVVSENVQVTAELTAKLTYISNELHWMKHSKFWKLRTIWTKLTGR